MWSFFGGVFTGLLKWAGTFLIGWLFGRSKERKENAEDALDKARRADEIERDTSTMSDEELLEESEKWERRS